LKNYGKKSYCQVFLENLVQVPMLQVQEPVENQEGTERIHYEKES
jgi:hypothetical protein